MADFKDIMRDWKRMCDYYSQDDDSCCQACPITLAGKDCYTIYEVDDAAYFDGIESVVSKWAEEHPVEYPYMIDVLQEVFNMPNGLSSMNIWEWINTIHIPADIAKKLGIKPKEM